MKRKLKIRIKRMRRNTTSTEMTSGTRYSRVAVMVNRLVPQVDQSVKLYNHGEGPY